MTDMRKSLPYLLPLFLLALAQVDLTLSPARVELTLLPGEPFAVALLLQNGSSREEALSARLTGFRLGEDGSLLEIEDAFCQGLKVLPSAFTLPPSGQAGIRVEGVAPRGEGTHACLVAFGGSPRPGTLGGVRVSVRPEIGLALYVTLKGTEKPRLRGRVGGEGKELPLLLENPGNVLLRVSGEALVLDPAGREMARIPLPETPLLPGGTRRLLLAPQAPLPPGRYRAVLVVESAYGRYALEGLWVVP